MRRAIVEEIRRLVLVTSVVLAYAGIAAADVIEPSGFASVFSVVDNIGAIPGIEPGSLLGFVYGFESTAADLDPDPNVGVYFGGSESLILAVDIADLVFVCSFSDILISNDDPLFDDDSYFVSGDVCTGTTVSIDLLLIDPSKTVFDSDALPTELDIADFDLPTLFIEGCPVANPSCDPQTQGFAIVADIVEFDYLPEPTSSTLGLTALSVLAGLRTATRRVRADPGEHSGRGKPRVRSASSASSWTSSSTSAEQEGSTEKLT